MAEPAQAGTRVDVVVVSYNNRDELRSSVEPLTAYEDAHVIVVDNASSDGTLASVADLRLTALPQADNGGFAHGCNVGWRAGTAPYVMFLNPDARIEKADVDRLVATLEADRTAGAVAPRIVESDGSVAHSLRRFPRPMITFAQALFVHRLLPNSPFANDIICDDAAYERPGNPDWASGAAIMVRRFLLEELGGFDERFFMYCEDVDLCRRLRLRGSTVRFEPEAVALHEGGASAPRAALLPVLAQSRVLYARKHFPRPRRYLEQAGVALGALTHVALTRGGRAARAGHAKAFLAALRPTLDARPRVAAQEATESRLALADDPSSARGR